MNPKIIKVFWISVVLLLGMTGCARGQVESTENPPSFTSGEANATTDITNIETGIEITEVIDKEEVDISYYVEFAQSVIAYDRFFGGPRKYNTTGKVMTDFYYDEDKDEIILVPEDAEEEYYISQFKHGYARYSCDKRSITTNSFMEFLGRAEVDYDVEASYSLPKITKENQYFLDELSAYIYDQLSLVQESFSYDIYLGDFCRGYEDGKEYVSVWFAVMGERKYYSYVEFTVEEDGYSIFLFPPIINVPFYTEMEEENESDVRVISNIVSLDYLIKHLKK